MTATLSLNASRRQHVWLTGPEILLIGFVAMIALMAFGLSEIWDRDVAWDVFLPPVFMGIGIFAFGSAIRALRGMERMGLLMIGAALYLNFGIFMTIFGNCFFPVLNPIVDDRLMAVDAMLGYKWVDFLVFLTDYPFVAKALGYLYPTSLIQLGIVFICLAYLNRAATLYRLVLTGTLALLLTMVIWAIWPSFGPSAYQTVPADVAMAINLFTDNAYGAQLLNYAQNGIPEINPDAIKATIAFPSFHIIMSCLIVWFLRKTPFFWFFFALNIPMIPATMAHGGHHMVDLIGGAIVFCVAAFIATRVLAYVSPPTSGASPVMTPASST